MILNALVASMKVTLVSTVLVVILGTLLAKFLLRKNNSLKKAVETIILFPLFMPPSLIGYFIISVLGKNSAIGSFLYNNLGISVIFTLSGAVIATFVVSFPIFYGAAKGAFLSVPHDYEEMALDLGANEIQAFFKITLPLAYKSLLSGLILCFARAFGEFGATIMVAGNIEGKTQTIPLALYYSVEYGNESTMLKLALITIIISTTLIFIYNKLLK